MKLARTRFYIVDLDSRVVDTSRRYRTMQEAIDAARAQGRRRFTALRGARIMDKLHIWIVPEEGTK